MARAVIEWTDPPQRHDGVCLYELWELTHAGRKLAKHGSVSVTFRRGNPDPTQAQLANDELHRIAQAAGLAVVREPWL